VILIENFCLWQKLFYDSVVQTVCRSKCSGVLQKYYKNFKNWYFLKRCSDFKAFEIQKPKALFLLVCHKIRLCLETFSTVKVYRGSKKFEQHSSTLSIYNDAICFEN